MVLFSMFPRGDGRERRSRAGFEGDVSARAGRAMWARRGRFGRPDGRGGARASGIRACLHVEGVWDGVVRCSREVDGDAHGRERVQRDGSSKALLVGFARGARTRAA
jgi:hypothetical protein